MSKIILSQRVDIPSDYADQPFKAYHFPKRYIRQIEEGDDFIYYQGNRQVRAYRYYFGKGTIGTIHSTDGGSTFYAQILKGTPFVRKVPIYSPDGNGYIESLAFEEIRNGLVPPWQNSIRKISEKAFAKILWLSEQA